LAQTADDEVQDVSVRALLDGIDVVLGLADGASFVRGAVFDPAKHPRYPKGHPKGGKFMTKADIAMTIADALTGKVAAGEVKPAKKPRVPRAPKAAKAASAKAPAKKVATPAETLPRRRPKGPKKAKRPKGGTEVPAAAKAYHRNLDGVEDLAEHVESGSIRDRRIPLTSSGASGATVERVEFADGSMAVAKTYAGFEPSRFTVKHQADAEHLSSLLARALGVSSPGVYRREFGETWQEYVPHPSADEVRMSLMGDVDEVERLYRRASRSDAGRRLGLLDLMTLNFDRHEGNWLVGDHGRPVAIDHQFSFDPDLVDREAFAYAAVRSPFTDRYMDRTFGPIGANGLNAYEWNESNPLTRDDVDELRRRLEALRPDFAHRGRENWLNYALRILDALEPHARGKRSIL